jgi:cytochrome c
MKSVLISALVAASVLAAAPAFANKDLATKSGCLACHATDKRVVGPSYQEIAKKYAGDAKAEARLIERVTKGTAATGGQVWKDVNGGAVPMPANAAVKPADIKTLVTWVLAGAK